MLYCIVVQQDLGISEDFQVLGYYTLISHLLGKYEKILITEYYIQ